MLRLTRRLVTLQFDFFFVIAASSDLYYVELRLTVVCVNDCDELAEEVRFDCHLPQCERHDPSLKFQK